MKVAIFSAQNFEKPFLEEANKPYQHQLDFFPTQLTAKTVSLAEKYSVISCFVSDNINAQVLKTLANHGTKLIALRSAGFNHVDLEAARKHNIAIARVPAYSPYAVAEFATGLVLTLSRKIHRAYMRTREHNFSLEGLLGFDLHNRTIGIIGTGKIGSIFAKIMIGFGCKVLAYDVTENTECKKLGVEYTNLKMLYNLSDIISLHCPLNKDTTHLINDEAIQQMRDGVMLINTGRGGLIDTKAVIKGLKSKKIGYLGIDVYEEEENLFFKDLSSQIIQDDVFTRLETFPNVIITSHQGFFTQEAITNIAKITLLNITRFEQGSSEICLVTPPLDFS